MIRRDVMASMQYRIKALERENESLKNGDACKKMKLSRERMRKYYERQLKQCKTRIETLEREMRSILDMWFDVFEDIQDDCKKKLAEKDALIDKIYQELRKLREKLIQKTNELVETRAKLQDKEDKNQELKAQLNQNFENSSRPSSQVPFRNKVANNREATEKKPGGQPGHVGHGRKPHEVNGDSVFIPAPPEIENNPDYYRVEGENGEVHKQVIDVTIAVTVTDYYAHVYRNRETGARYHAPFPPNIQLDVNYGESVKALIFMMKNHLNVSEAKITEFLHEMTNGEINVSRGMINHINGEFSAKSKAEQDEIFANLVRSDVMYADLTTARLNGKLKYVVVCTNGTDMFYGYRDKKGDAAFKGTPVELFLNTLVHDHDKTMYHYGGAHQECNAHHLRYLKGATENEPELKWHGQMRSLLQEMNRTRDAQERILTPEQISAFETEYDRILKLAEQEYNDNPPTEYYRKGYNLFKEFLEYKEHVLHFLKHPEVDFTNNEAERGGRQIKRHMVNSGTFRGETGHCAEEYCGAMSVLQSAKLAGENIYQKILQIFGRATSPKKEEIEPVAE